MRLEVRGETVHAGTGGRPFDAERPVVVFLHGSGLDHTFWSLHTRFFAYRGYAVLAPDLPGHSLSGGKPLDRVEAMADWLHEVLAAVEANDVSLVGHSQGCLVALEYAARYPQGVRSLSCVASGLATPVNPALIEAAVNAPDKAVALMTAWGFGPAGQKHLGPVPGNAMLLNGQRIMRRNAPAALAADLKACNAYENGRLAAAAVECPAQVIIGAMDRMAPRKATEDLAATLPSAETRLIEGSGHMVPVEAPDSCRKALSEFIFLNHPFSR
jgi:pimeloyl-ACP methyl ester carboxylesterase